VVFYKAPHNEYSCCSGLGITYGVKVVFFFVGLVTAYGQVNHSDLWSC